jgi:hypothetical protein
VWSILLEGKRRKNRSFFSSYHEAEKILLRTIGPLTRAGHRGSPVQAGGSCISKRWTGAARVSLEA